MMENENLWTLNQQGLAKDAEPKENADYRGIAGKASLNAADTKETTNEAGAEVPLDQGGEGSPF